MMRLVSWNILAGGGRRCGTIAARLLECDADVLVLQETVTIRGPDLCHQFVKAGYEYRFSAPRGSRERGLRLLEASATGQAGSRLCPGTRACILAGGSR